MNEIVVKQIPIITHDLVRVGISVTERINALNLGAQVVTEETIQTLKKTKAELAKEATDWENQRKTVKKAVNAPYDEFEAVYKAEVIEKYKAADETLKTKINEFEMKIKIEKKQNLQLYFVELCEMEQIDWLTFDRLNIDVNLSTTEKKYKEQIFEFIGKLVEDMDLINSEQYAAEMLVEYKKTLNVSKAIKDIRERKESEKLEQERIRQNETNRRTALLRNLSFVFHDLTRTYNNVQYDDLMISMQDIENLSRDTFNERLVNFEIEIQKRKPQPVTVQPEILQAPTVIAPVQTAPVQTTPVQAETFEARFKITDTYERLTALKNFLVTNNYKYENL